MILTRKTQEDLEPRGRYSCQAHEAHEGDIYTERHP